MTITTFFQDMTISTFFQFVVGFIIGAILAKLCIAVLRGEL